MKKIFWILVVLTGLVAVAIWQWESIPLFKVHRPSSIVHRSTQYTCPMHPQVVKDKPGRCPICGMELVPVEVEGEDHQHEGHKHPEGSYLVSPERRQLIGVKTAPVEMKNIKREIRLPGHVAYDQELYITEQEYVHGLKSGVESEVLKAIETKLVRLGISEEELMKLKRTRAVDASLFLPKAQGPVWIYANIYEADLSWITKGMKAIVSLPKESSIFLEGEVKQITPVIDPMTRTAQARIFIYKSEVSLKPETYVDVVLQKDLGQVLAVPASAVIETGTKQIVLVDLGEGYMEPRKVKLGRKADKDFPVIEGLEKGEVVITSAHFLLDSEAELQAAMKRFGRMPAGHQH